MSSDSPATPIRCLAQHRPGSLPAGAGGQSQHNLLPVNRDTEPYAAEAEGLDANRLVGELLNRVPAV